MSLSPYILLCIPSKCSGCGHNQNGSHLDWPTLPNVACHPESMTLHLESKGATETGCGGYWDGTKAGKRGTHHLCRVPPWLLIRTPSGAPRP